MSFSASRKEGGDWTEFLRTLKDKCDLVDVIGSNVKLERRGYQYWACCPFHHEKTPSFAVNAADRYYHCFGCGRSGDVITFVKEYENVDFMQAVQILAARAGLEMPAFDERAAQENAEKKKKRDRLSALMKDAAHFYLGNLYSGRAEEHLAYIAKRGISPSTAKKFGLGASLDYKGLPAHLLAHGYTQEECAESGSCALTEDGELIDSLGGRLIIPIINNFDEVIAFGGRVMHPTDHAKYKNTRETLLFNKSKTLYNINLVKREKRLAAIPNLIMLEGYMDVISLYQAGFRNVVASMGTSLTSEQVRLAKRYTDTVLISYDGDAAGQNANLRGLSLLEREGIRIRVVPLPDGLDPDDVIRKQGAEGYQKCLDAAMPLIDYRLLSAKRKYDLTRSDERRGFIKEALPIVREAESATEREELLKRISEESGVSVGSLLSDLEKGPVAKEREAAAPEKKEETKDRDLRAARFVLCACLLSKPYALAYEPNEEDFSDETHKTIARFILSSRKEGNVRPSGIFDLIPPEDGELSEVFNLDYGDNLDGPSAERFFRDCTAALARRALAEKRAAEYEAYEAAQTDEEKRAILARIDAYTKKMKNIGGTV